MISNRLLKKDRLYAFTLVELLVGMSIFSIIIFSLFSTFANGIRLHKKSQEVEDLYRDIRWSINSLARDLANVIPFSYTGGQGQIHEIRVNAPSSRNVPVTLKTQDASQEQDVKGSLIGDESSLSFILPHSSGLKLVRYYLESPEEVEIFKTTVGGFSQMPRSLKVHSTEGASPIQFLIREESSLFGNSLGEDSTSSEKEILSLNILKDSLKFFYAEYHKEDFSADINWRNEWNDEVYPVGIRMELIFIDPGDQKKRLSIQKDIFIPRGGWSW